MGSDCSSSWSLRTCNFLSFCVTVIDSQKILYLENKQNQTVLQHQKHVTYECGMLGIKLIILPIHSTLLLTKSHGLALFCPKFLENFEGLFVEKSNRKAMNRNWSNQKENPALKTEARNK